ncbi:uncharacterized protein LOC117178721 [Belonocnema kinseyi]|uniref:uncharacterized protein LOC117178721 n=1 Tax=Belonocnema kinseyi TaxID=2817044 RepID=UPI00143E0AAD|nr:uncharacterized protein LOC117178721 [Belonocnema kinseyi]
MNFKGTYSANLKNYCPAFKNRTNADHASDVVVTCIKREIPFDEVDLQTDLEAVAVQVISDTKLCVCNIYIPNWFDLCIGDLKNLILKLPRPFVLLGDFNSHNTLRGSKRTDQRGKILDTGPTYFNVANGSFSSIDLSICSASLGHRLKWEVLENLYNSDHFPILIKLTSPHQKIYEKEPRWKIHQTDWMNFQKFMDEKNEELVDPSQNNWDQIDDLILNLINLIIEAADSSIPKSSNKSQKPQVPWWNEEVDKALKDKKHALNIKFAVPQHARQHVFEQKTGRLAKKASATSSEGEEKRKGEAGDDKAERDKNNKKEVRKVREKWEEWDKRWKEEKYKVWDKLESIENRQRDVDAQRSRDI